MGPLAKMRLDSTAIKSCINLPYYPDHLKATVAQSMLVPLISDVRRNSISTSKPPSSVWIKLPFSDIDNFGKRGYCSRHAACLLHVARGIQQAHLGPIYQSLQSSKFSVFAKFPTCTYDAFHLFPPPFCHNHTASMAYTLLPWWPPSALAASSSVSMTFPSSIHRHNPFEISLSSSP